MVLFRPIVAGTSCITRACTTVLYPAIMPASQVNISGDRYALVLLAPNDLKHATFRGDKFSRYIQACPIQRTPLIMTPA
jgi:hypothetical protein